MTLPLLMALASTENADRARLEELLAATPEARRTALPEAQRLLTACSAFARARAKADALIAEAIACLASFPDSEAKQALTGLAGYVLTRTK